MAQKRIMKEFTISEISGVDEPAQAPALMTLMKSRKGFTADEFGKQKEGQMPKTAEELQAELTKSAEETAALKAQLAKSEEARKMAEAKAKLTPAELDALEGETDGEVAKMLANPELLKAKVASKTEANPVIYKSKAGDEFRKNDDPRLVAMAKRDDERETEMAKMREDAANEAFSKRATTEFAKFKGTPEVKVALLKAVAGIKDDELRKGVNELLKAAHGGMAVVLKEIGTQADDTTGDDGQDLKKSAETELDKLAKDHMAKNAGMTFAKAYSEVILTDKGQKLYAQAAG